MLTLQEMLQWSASFRTRNNKGRAAVIIAQTEGQGLWHVAFDAIIKLQACDADIKLQACFDMMTHLSLTRTDSCESMSMPQDQAVIKAYPRSLTPSAASELLSGPRGAQA